MPEPAQFEIQEGGDKGKRFSVPAGGGVRIGRSSSSDVPLNDPSASRFHCRVFFKEDGRLWVADLGSANETLVNNVAVQEAQVRTGDLIAVGDSVIRVVSDGTTPAPVVVPPVVPAPSPAQGAPAAPPPVAAPVAPPVQAVPAGSVPPSASVPPAPPTAAPAASAQESVPFVDLGLGPAARQKIARKPNLAIILPAVALLALVLLAVWVFSSGRIRPESKAGPSQRVKPSGPEALEIQYERVDGSVSNIFRYQLAIAGGQASVQVDDLQNARHFTKPVTKVRNEASVLGKLAVDVEQSGFFGLEPLYRGRTPNVYDLRDLCITVGSRTHRVKVLNAIEPPEFAALRKAIEEFGINEFGIRALARPSEELVGLAREKMLVGKTLYEEKNVRHENLFNAVRALKEAEIYVETIDPKPEFYPDAVALRSKCEEELSQVYQDLRFQAERAIKMRMWKEAAEVLQTVCTTIPDRSHEWHQQAERQLIDVQRRVEKN